MIPFFIFNGKNSKDMGIIVNKMPAITRPEMKVEEIVVPGRSGSLYIKENEKYDTYEPFTYQIECTLIDNANTRNIFEWLKGEGKLILSRETDKFYNVLIKSKIDLEQVYQVCNEFSIEFQVQPFAYSVCEKEQKLLSSTEITILDSTYYIKPYIKVIGNGDISLSINDKTMVLKNIEDYIELDCELEEAFKGNINCNNKVYSEDFLYLEPEKNLIDWLGDVSSVELKYREVFL